jgi:hypothetical protein
MRLVHRNAGFAMIAKGPQHNIVTIVNNLVPDRHRSKSRSSALPTRPKFDPFR